MFLTAKPAKLHFHQSGDISAHSTPRWSKRAVSFPSSYPLPIHNTDSALPDGGSETGYVSAPRTLRQAILIPLRFSQAGSDALKTHDA
jgi:hypothetical protein